MGLDVYLYHCPDRAKIKAIDGINRILERLGICEGLSEIMGAGDEYEFFPNWKECQDRATAALEKLRTMPGKNKWCEQALENIIETCRFVLGQPDPENYYVHWSS